MSCGVFLIGFVGISISRLFAPGNKRYENIWTCWSHLGFGLNGNRSLFMSTTKRDWSGYNDTRICIFMYVDVAIWCRRSCHRGWRGGCCYVYIYSFFPSCSVGVCCLHLAWTGIVLYISAIKSRVRIDILIPALVLLLLTHPAPKRSYKSLLPDLEQTNLLKVKLHPYSTTRREQPCVVTLSVGSVLVLGFRGGGSGVVWSGVVVLVTYYLLLDLRWDIEYTYTCIHIKARR